jgi:hypothetical protein
MCRKPEVIALHALPPTVLHETIQRLTAGQRVSSVARWLMTQYRGVLQNEPVYNIRKHVAELKCWITSPEDKPAAPDTDVPSTPNSQLTRQEAFKPANGSAPPTTRDIINQGLMNFEELWREIDEQEGNTTIRVKQKIELLHTIPRIIAESNKADTIELARQKAFGQSSLLDTFEGMTLDGRFLSEVQPVAVNGRPVLSAPAATAAAKAPPSTPTEVLSAQSPEREAELKELREGFAKLPASDRMLARHELGLLRRILKLQDKIDEAKKAAEAPPSEPQP